MLTTLRFLRSLFLALSLTMTAPLSETLLAANLPIQINIVVPSEGPDPTLSVNAGLGHHPISPDIYGMNYASEQLAVELKLPVRRWGGNSTTRYNWQGNLHNTASDWYFGNYQDGTAGPDGSASDLFVEQDRRTGTKTLMTVPLIGWTSRADRPNACGFSVSKYGAQQSVASDRPDCGNGITSGGVTITGNDPTDTSTAIDPTFVTGWLAHLTGRYGTASNGGVAFYNLDNEPMLWHSTHRDVHPLPTTYDEIRDKTWLYGSAVKAADQSARSLGPTVWGWCAYFYSALDGCSSGTDYLSHGNTPFVPWYLQQMKIYEQQHGVRILDYLDLHYYPQTSSVALSPAGSAATQTQRLRSTRSLWDPTYRDESWINDTIRLIPRMHEWADINYPGTRLAITEYNWGGLESINGALAQADVLGIFGREGLDLAALWASLSDADPGAFAFRIYRNYDGTGHGFGDTSVQATSTDQDTLALYAALRSSDGALTLVIINKSGVDVTSTVSLSGFSPTASAAVYRYSSANPGAIEHTTDQSVTAQGFSATFPAASITLYAIPFSTPVNYSLTLQNTGNGVINNLTPPPAFDCTTASCSGTFPLGTSFIFRATPSTGSLFGSWSGCNSINTSGDCLLTLTDTSIVTASFDLIRAVRIGTGYYQSIIDAYAAAGQTGITTIEAQALTFDGDLLLNKAILLRGGFDAVYSSIPAGVTTVRGKVTVGTGSFIADRVAIN